MSGMLPATGKSSSGRKQWTLHDGPRGSIQRLRKQLAEDGCPESQISLAKQLLEERCELDFDKAENARTAVYWLIKSSEQGHEEATNLLKKCFKTGRGINEQNYLDVKSCINMKQEEKLARKAAREMFASLSNGEDFITSDQLQKRMIEIYKNVDCSHTNSHKTDDNNDATENSEIFNGNVINSNQNSEVLIDWSNRIDTDNQKLTEDNMITAAINYAHGELPLVNQTLCLTTPNPNALNNIPYFHRSIAHPLLTLKILYYKLIRFFGDLPNFPYLPIAKTNMQLLCLLTIYFLISSDSLMLLIPMGLYYLSFISMIVTTFQALQVQYDFSDFRVWSSLFLCYSGGSLNANEAEYQFIRNNLKPFGQFFLSLLIHLMIYPTVAVQWIPQSEFTVIAFVLTFLSLITFVRKQTFDLFLLFSFGINVLARYPYESDVVVTQTWRFLDLKVPSFASYVVGNGIEFCLAFRTLLFCVVCGCFIKIAVRENGRGIYKYLIPHCLTLSWLQIVIISSQGATMYGLLRGTLALVGLVLFLPLASLASFLLPIVALANYVYESDYFHCLILMLIFGVGVVTMLWLLTRTKYKKYINHFHISWMIFALSVFGLLIVLYPERIQETVYEAKLQTFGGDEQYTTDLKINDLTWEQFQSYCYQQSKWDDNNLAATQFSCARLDNLAVNWDGYISTVKISSIENSFKRLLDRLPNPIKDHLYCTFGDKEHKTNCLYENTLDCYLEQNNLKQCHMNAWNQYQFEIVVKMASGNVWTGSTSVIDIVLIAENAFKNFTLNLKPGDHIWFRGQLTNAFNRNGDELIGGLKPHIKLIEIGCSGCHNTKLNSYKLQKNYLLDIKITLNYFYIGFKTVLNFLFTPLILYE